MWSRPAEEQKTSHGQGGKVNPLETVPKSKLSPRKARLIPFIIAAPSIEEGCRRAEISTVTFYEYLKDEDFVAELKKARETTVNDALENMKSAATKAVDKLVGLLDSEDENIRRRASVDILTFITKWKEISEVEGKLAQIERVVMERKIYQQ